MSAAAPVAARRASVALGPDEVHVWTAWLDGATPQSDSLERLLSSEERERAQRLGEPQVSRRFVARRALRRRILARYVDCAPERLELRGDPRGRPSLGGGGDAPAFSISHSAGLAAVAVARAAALGVDVERVSDAVEPLEIAERFFSAREIAELRAAPPSERPERFFALWTAKEAYAKAVGEGLRLPLDRIEVAFGRGEPPGFRSLPCDAANPASWRLRLFVPAPGWIGAPVVR
jgi:4'-phosphopantetheinyl transferase